MSILLVLVALVALVFVGGAVIAVYFVMRGDSSGDRERLVQASSVRLAEQATDVAFFFRFEQQDATDAKALVERFHVQLSPSETRDAALELTRLVPSATHAYLGPCAWPPVKAYSPVTLGVIVGFRARTRASLDTVLDDRQLTGLAATLRQVSALPDDQLLGGHLQVAADSTDPDAPRLVAVDQGALPGHRPCPHCRKPMPVFATRCDACGSRAMS
ncbi:MAG: hypothetical protein IPG17_07965 [Sandaracinaceae bacterium]|jgi:hypothetical protein|nr:hypothetical protein [Sandaracinaceae bacterium]MBK7152691.1 hypothetical protein [Sandaracinaceae bacterium]